MLSSGIIDLAIGLAFVFGVTAALASVATELMAAARTACAVGLVSVAGFRRLAGW